MTPVYRLWNMKMHDARPRLNEIDIAKGFAIVLVVYGHIVARTPPLGNDWYSFSKEFVYLFHMPFFMFLGGVIAGYHQPTIADFGQYRRYVASKFQRLFPAYLMFGTVIVAGKLAASHYVHVDNLPPSFDRGVVDVLLFPSRSSASFLWFVYVLFLHYATLPPLLLMFRQKLGWLIVLGLALYWVDGPDFLALGDYLKYFVFFVAGVWASRNYAAVAAILDRYFAWFMLLFLCSLSGAIHLGLHKFWVGVASLPALLGLSRLPAMARNETLAFLGRASFPIYLMNTLAIGVVKSLGLKIAPWDGDNFLIYAPLLLVSGLTLPLLAKHFLIVRLPVLDRITS